MANIVSRLCQVYPHPPPSSLRTAGKCLTIIIGRGHLNFNAYNSTAVKHATPTHCRYTADGQTRGGLKCNYAAGINNNSNVFTWAMRGRAGSRLRNNKALQLNK